MFFEKHRHLGMDLYLLTQDRSKLAKDVQILVEKEIRALPRSLNIFGELKYNEYVNGMKSNAVPMLKKPKKLIFGLYQSMSKKESEKIKSPLRRIAVGCTVGLLLGSYFLYNHWSSKIPKAEAAGIVQDLKTDYKTKGSVKQSKNVGISTDMAKKYRWKSVSYVLINDDLTTMQIYDPVDQDLYPLDVYPHKLRIKRNRVYARISLIHLEKIRQRKPHERLAPERGGLTRAERPNAYDVVF